MNNTGTDCRVIARFSVDMTDLRAQEQDRILVADSSPRELNISGRVTCEAIDLFGEDEEQRLATATWRARAHQCGGPWAGPLVGKVLFGQRNQIPDILRGYSLVFPSQVLDSTRVSFMRYVVSHGWNLTSLCYPALEMIRGYLLVRLCLPDDAESTKVSVDAELEAAATA